MHRTANRGRKHHFSHSGLLGEVFMGHSWGIRRVFMGYTYVSGMCRVCIGYVSGMRRDIIEAKKVPRLCHGERNNNTVTRIL